MKSKAAIIASGAILIAAPVVMSWEGLRLGAYLDPIGIPTACYGYTKGVELGQIYTQVQCNDLLLKELKEAEQAVIRNVKIPITHAEKAAYISFVYNVGQGNFQRSTLLRKLNSGDRIGACEQLTRWVYAGGKRLQGLVNRRKEERELCLSGL